MWKLVKHEKATEVKKEPRQASAALACTFAAKARWLFGYVNQERLRVVLT